MIYPSNFEQKIGFNDIRVMLKEHCLSALGREKVDRITFSTDVETINEWLEQVREFRRLQEEADDFPLQYFFDVRQSVARIRLDGTYLETNELFDLRRSLETIHLIVRYLNRTDEPTDSEPVRYPYPALHRLTQDVLTFPQLIQRIDQLIDKFGNIRDSASVDLARIQSELAKTEGSVSRTLYSILRLAQSEGLVEKDVNPTLRDGRLVIPVAPGLKRRIKGIVHDESATGRTVYIEPAEVVEANNRIRELEAEEKREIIRILKEFSVVLRPRIDDILYSYDFLAVIDLVRAKALLAARLTAFEPVINAFPHIDWIQAVHPLLQSSLQKQEKSVVPLDIMLTREHRILIISGPNAGGKSVCLKTVGLLQYMLQCGLSIPIGERSTVGIFQNIMIDIGDEQSIENDLSTYSSHLMNMKQMIRQADDCTLLLIDEFGSGTEPQIGGAIAESVLRQYCKKDVYGVITTHYQNLKYFAEDHNGVVNGAMLYDRQEMRALFQLQIGQPGSSFAIEIARKTGLPEEVICDASEMVGTAYIQSEKYLQDIIRDKRYWENKRRTVHQREKEMEKTIAKYENAISEIEQNRKDILRKAREEAEELLRESNRKIEQTIREIRESQAEKEETKRIREELNAFKEEVKEFDTKDNDEKIARKMVQIQQRKERHEKRKREKAEERRRDADAVKVAVQDKRSASSAGFQMGDAVRIKGLSSVGKVKSVDGKIATVIFGDMRTKMRTDRLEYVKTVEQAKTESSLQSYSVSRSTRETIDNRKLNFKQDLDIRGMRGDEALNAVTYFIDDAILVGMPRVRILHGKGNGILRQLIRQYLSTVPNVADYHDEHVQFGGAGITVVDF
ncbi:Smr/MutS family protein [Hoylesella pleuritidis]|uniref:endonuclease MutS2 n=1 Tax=Hoylesella pleuritidis TaxID=407975 RepID=UPI0028E927FD|nr:Smr/MutS family protein [Hoylesella pleuritidis]